MDPRIICGRALQEFICKGYAQVDGYYKFTYISHNSTSVTIGRETGKDTTISFNKLIKVIEGYQSNIEDYNEGPSKTRDYGLTHVNSPVWSILHLLPKEEYCT